MAAGVDSTVEETTAKKMEGFKMTRSSSFLAVSLLCALATALLADSSFALAGGNCQDKLAGNTYVCSFKYSNEPNEPPYHDCMFFVTGGVSANFDVVVDGNHHGCSCLTTGSANSPSFDASSSAWACVGDDGFEYSGTVKGKKLRGQSVGETGDSAIYTCTFQSESGDCVL